MIYLVSDLHLGSPYCLHDKLLRFLQTLREGEDELFVVGDLLDSPEGPFTTDDYEVMRELKRLQPRWVWGNHDEDCEAFSKLFDCVYYQIDGVVFSKGKKFVLDHGHRYDRFFVRHNRLSMYLNRWYLLAYCIHPAVGRWFKRQCVDWTDCTKSVQYHANIIARYEGAEAVVCGHTHKAMHEGSYVNVGCWTDDKETFYATISDGRLELHYFP